MEHNETRLSPILISLSTVSRYPVIINAEVKGGDECPVISGIPITYMLYSSVWIIT